MASGVEGCDVLCPDGLLHLCSTRAARIGKRLIERNLEDGEIDSLAILAVAGIAAEGQAYEEVGCVHLLLSR